MKLKWLWWLGVSLILIGLVWWGYDRFWVSANGQTTTVERGEIIEELILTGQVQADEYVRLRFLTGGRLSSVNVSENERVVKGQLLARQDPSALQTRVTSTYNRWLAAQANAEAVEDEVKDNDDDESFEIKNKRVTAQTARDAAYFEWQQALADLRNVEIRAPFAGVVTSIGYPFAQVNIQATESQIELLNPESIYFSVAADQIEVSDLQVGQKVEIILDSDQDRSYPGRVRSIALTPQESAAGIVYQVKVDFDGVSPQLRLGQTGDAIFVVGRAKNSLWVPPQYVGTDTQGDYIIVDSRGTKKYIEVGVEGEDRIQIDGDVSQGDVVYD
jgi:RND family efflux transporter MFP subunit